MPGKNPKLNHSLIDGLSGYRSPIGTWELGPKETFETREKLLSFLHEAGAKSALLKFIRAHDIPRHVSNLLLEAFDIPCHIPGGALRALELSEKSWHPLDHPVSWGKSDQDDWLWRRNDKPIAAVQKPDGSWETVLATY